MGLLFWKTPRRIVPLAGHNTSLRGDGKKRWAIFRHLPWPWVGRPGKGNASAQATLRLSWAGLRPL